MKFKLKLLHIKCHVLEFTKDEAPKAASRDNSKFMRKRFVSHGKHILFALEESVPHRITYTYESQ
jgi:hypothetical protein